MISAVSEDLLAEEQAFSEDWPVPAELVVMAGRLPVAWVPAACPDDPDAGRWQRAPGGVATALGSALRGRSAAWVGWPGPRPSDGVAPPASVGETSIVPVDLDEDELQHFYRSYANEGLWPLLHGLAPQSPLTAEAWASYRAVNARFAEVAAQRTAIGGAVWVHDYQLMLVPMLLRALRPDVRIGYFHHVPFLLPSGAEPPGWAELLQSLQACDVVGVQTERDAEGFIGAVRSSLAAAAPGAPCVLPEVRVFPVSVDVERLQRVAARSRVRDRALELRAGLAGRTLVLGVDRLDYTKAIPARLEALRQLLCEESIRPEDVLFVQVANPGRDGVRGYETEAGRVAAGVRRLAGWEGPGGDPVARVEHRTVDEEELVALYLAADVLLVTSLADGMNLVAKEYVAVRQCSGALVLSRTAGAAQELADAYLVDPFDAADVARGLQAALQSSPAECRARMTAMAAVVNRYDVHRWADDCLRSLRFESQA